MPPKKNKKSKKPNNNDKKNNTAKNHTENNKADDEDELLNTLIAENEILAHGADAQHGMLQAPFGRKPNDELTPAEEQRRIADASVLQKLAFQQLGHPRQGKRKAKHDYVHQPQNIVSKAKELLLGALYVLAGQHQRVPTAGDEDPHLIKNAARIPPIFMEQHNKYILTPKLLCKAEEIFCILLRDMDEHHRQLRSEVVADALMGLTHSGHTLQNDTKRLVVEVFRRVGRYDEAIELLQQLAVTTSGDKAQLLEKLDRIAKEKEQVQNQMGDAELTCPICLSDCRRPCRPVGCPHIVCEACLSKHLENSKVCPVCRNPTRSFDPVSDSEQVLYYFKRLDRDIDDAVAWYNLIFTSLHMDFLTELHCRVREKIKAVTIERYTCWKAINYAVQALRRNPDVAEDLWSLFAEIFVHTTIFRRLDRDRITYDLGNQFGKMTALEAATKALNTPHATKSERPWFTMAELMCRDYADEIRAGTFSVKVNGEQYDAVKIAAKLFSANGEHIRAACRLIFVLYLTDDIKNNRLVEAHFFDDSKTDMLSAVFLFEAFHRCDNFAAYLHGFDFYYLAIAWRDLKQMTDCTSAPELWGKALTTADHQCDVTTIAEAMMQDDVALVDGVLIDREGALAMAKKFVSVNGPRMGNQSDDASSCNGRHCSH